MKTLKELNKELDAFNATLNDENEDTPELLAEQERLLNAIIAAEAADLARCRPKNLLAHFDKRAPGQHMTGKGLSKAALIARSTPCRRIAAPEPDPTHPPLPRPRPSARRVCHRAWPRRTRATQEIARGGLRAPYTLEQVEKVVGREPDPHLSPRFDTTRMLSAPASRSRLSPPSMASPSPPHTQRTRAALRSRGPNCFVSLATASRATSCSLSKSTGCRV